MASQTRAGEETIHSLLVFHEFQSTGANKLGFQNGYRVPSLFLEGLFIKFN